MITLRAVFLLAGLATGLPCAAFLVLFRPPYSGSLRGARSDVWWIATSLRLLATAVALGGFRIVVASITHREHPVVFIGWFDAATAIATLFFAALASVFFFAVFITYKRWPPEQ